MRIFDLYYYYDPRIKVGYIYDSINVYVSNGKKTKLKESVSSIDCRMFLLKEARYFVEKKRNQSIFKKIKDIFWFYFM